MVRKGTIAIFWSLSSTVFVFQMSVIKPMFKGTVFQPFFLSVNSPQVVGKKGTIAIFRSWNLTWGRVQLDLG